MMKFKVGDKVVIKELPKYKGEITTIDDSRSKYTVYMGSINTIYLATYHDLILEEIWDSPLMKALREEDD